MIIHSIVYVVLTLLSATAIYAASMPVTKKPLEAQEQPQAPDSEKDTTDTL